MSHLQVFFPQNKLVKTLRSASPRTVQECMKQADENLRQIADACLEQVTTTLDMLEAAVTRWIDEAGDEQLAEVYGVSQRLIGVSTVARRPELDQAATSLCEVIDCMRIMQRPKLEPVAVHVGAMRLLILPATPGVDAAAILTGLLKVRDHFLAQARAQKSE